MIIPVNDVAPEWASDDAAVLNTFIASSTGQKLLQLLAFQAPVLLDGGHMNKTLVASGEVKGYSAALANLLSLRNSRPPEASGDSDSYPPLDDDSKWTDTTTQPTN